jgi:N-methylhydantoinase A
MGEPVEIVSVRATLRTPLPRRAERLPAARDVSEDGGVSTIQAYSFTLDQHAEFDIVNRRSLSARNRLAGPAIVVEPTATTYVDAGFSIDIHETGTMLMTEGRP